MVWSKLHTTGLSCWKVVWKPDGVIIRVLLTHVSSLGRINGTNVCEWLSYILKEELRDLWQIIRSLTNVKEKFEFTDEDDKAKYLGVDITKHKDGSIEFTQTRLIDRFVKLIDHDKNINIKPTPTIKSLLHKDLEGLKKHSWNYRQAIGMLTYLQGTTRPDISMTTH